MYDNSEKIIKYEKRIKGNNAFTIVALVDPQLRLDPIFPTNCEVILIDICRLFGDVVEEGYNYQCTPSEVIQITSWGNMTTYYSLCPVTTLLEEMDVR